MTVILNIVLCCFIVIVTLRAVLLLLPGAVKGAICNQNKQKAAVEELLRPFTLKNTLLRVKVLHSKFYFSKSTKALSKIYLKYQKKKVLIVAYFRIMC